jgi:outer membrane receptor for ferrienterochelin and colicins
MIYTLALSRERGESAAHLNVFFQTLNFHDRAVTPFTRFAISGEPLLSATDVQTRDTETKQDFEIGGDWNGPVGSGKLKLLFLASGFNLPDVNARQRTTGSTAAQLNRSVITQQQREFIVRGTYVFGGGAWETGAEAALNRYRQKTELFLDFNGDGRLEPAPIPEALARVQELRGEAFMTWNQTLAPRLKMESTLAAETSRITSSYALYPPRSAFFVKPRIDVRWSPTARDQIGLKLEREVSQLEFANFVPDYDPFNNRLNAGNPGIAPESKWRAQLRYEHRLARDAGTIEARAFAQLTQGEIDLAVIGTDASGAPVVADANIGNAWAWGAEGKFSVRLDALGVKGATLSGRYLRQWSRVRDPFRGDFRRVKGPNPYEFDLGFRHDLTGIGLSYGFDYRDVGDGIIFSDFASRDIFDVGPRLDLFAEKRLSGWLRLRIEAQQVNGAREYRNRDIFAISQADGALLRRETYVETRDRRFTVKLRGEF